MPISLNIHSVFLKSLDVDLSVTLLRVASHDEAALRGDQRSTR